jgi:hypothetical protein
MDFSGAASAHVRAIWWFLLTLYPPATPRRDHRRQKNLTFSRHAKGQFLGLWYFRPSMLQISEPPPPNTVFSIQVFLFLLPAGKKKFICRSWSSVYSFESRWSLAQYVASVGCDLWSMIFLYPLDRRLDGPQRHSGCGGEEKNSQPQPGIEP